MASAHSNARFKAAEASSMHGLEAADSDFPAQKYHSPCASSPVSATLAASSACTPDASAAAAAAASLSRYFTSREKLDLIREFEEKNYCKSTTLREFAYEKGLSKSTFHGWISKKKQLKEQIRHENQEGYQKQQHMGKIQYCDSDEQGRLGQVESIVEYGSDQRRPDSTVLTDSSPNLVEFTKEQQEEYDDIMVDFIRDRLKNGKTVRKSMVISKVREYIPYYQYRPTKEIRKWVTSFFERHDFMQLQAEKDKKKNEEKIGQIMLKNGIIKDNNNNNRDVQKSIDSAKNIEERIMTITPAIKGSRGSKYTNAQKLAMIKDFEEKNYYYGMSLRQYTDKQGLPKSTLYAWVTNRKQIENAPKEAFTAGTVTSRKRSISAVEGDSDGDSVRESEILNGPESLVSFSNHVAFYPQPAAQPHDLHEHENDHVNENTNEHVGSQGGHHRQQHRERLQQYEQQIQHQLFHQQQQQQQHPQHHHHPQFSPQNAVSHSPIPPGHAQFHIHEFNTHPSTTFSAPHPQHVPHGRTSLSGNLQPPRSSHETDLADDVHELVNYQVV